MGLQWMIHKPRPWREGGPKGGARGCKGWLLIRGRFKGSRDDSALEDAWTAMEVRAIFNKP